MGHPSQSYHNYGITQFCHPPALTPAKQVNCRASIPVSTDTRNVKIHHSQNTQVTVQNKVAPFYGARCIYASEKCTAWDTNYSDVVDWCGVMQQ